MSGDRSFRSRVEVWIYRRLRPLVAERQERRPLQIEGLAPLPEPGREPGGWRATRGSPPVRCWWPPRRRAGR
jgi:hypothetical protein